MTGLTVRSGALILLVISLLGCSSTPSLSEAQAVIFSKTQAELDAELTPPSSSTSPPKPTSGGVAASPMPSLSAGPTTFVSSTTTRQDPVSEAVAQMVEQLSAGLKNNRIQRFPMAISPFVELERASERHSGALGERLSESFIYQMQYTGFKMLDYRAVSLLTTFKDPINRQNISSLRNRNRVYFLLTGTYSRYPDGLVVNARVLDTTTRQVVAAAQTHIPDVRLEGALPGYNPLLALEKGMIIENQLGPIGIE